MSEYPPTVIATMKKKFEVHGYGQFKPGSCFAYNDEECLIYPEDRNLFRQGYRLAEISGTDGAEIKGGSCLQDLSYIFINDECDERTFKTNDSIQRRGIAPEDLLYIEGGESAPTGNNPGAQNADDTAIQKHQDKDLYSIDPIKVLDLVSFSISSWIEDERGQLRVDLKDNEKIGYVLGPMTMLLDLAPDDFECIFEGEYLPKGIACDLGARQNTILFECSGKTEEMRGNARFIPTPHKILELYTGEIRNRLNIRSLNKNNNTNDVKVGTQTPATGTNTDSCDQAPSKEANPEGRLRYLLKESERDDMKLERECILVAAVSSLPKHERIYKYRPPLAQWLFKDAADPKTELTKREDRLRTLGFDKKNGHSEKWNTIFNSDRGIEIQQLVKKLGFLRAK